MIQMTHPSTRSTRASKAKVCECVKKGDPKQTFWCSSCFALFNRSSMHVSCMHTRIFFGIVWTFCNANAGMPTRVSLGTRTIHPRPTITDPEGHKVLQPRPALSWSRHLSHGPNPYGPLHPPQPCRRTSQGSQLSAQNHEQYGECQAAPQSSTYWWTKSISHHEMKPWLNP